MNPELRQAFERLKAWFEPHERCAVAFSGGLDSTFLLAAIQQLTQTDVHAVTALTDYIPRWELSEAKSLAESIGVPHTIIELPVPDSVRDNPGDRCYRCKHAVFTALSQRMNQEGIDLLCDGTNVDDLSDYRPGLRALEQLGVESPLKSCGFTKQLIREGCRHFGLNELSVKPAYACLLTRLPHGMVIDTEILRRIEAAERVLHSLGCPDVRVRYDGDEAVRIEAGPKEFDMLLERVLLERIYRQLSRLGFTRISLDLGGYRRGSMNISREET